jgi:ubiquinone/menaquinone biosynthesis C-methylase UbiE
MPSKNHWETVYSTKSSETVSWFQPHAELSMRLIQETGVSKGAVLIDIGGGASTLVDDLLSNGFSNLSVLDLSAAALAISQQRLGDQASLVQWLEADITQAHFPASSIDVWHDRAVFHFLTTPAERSAYVKVLLHSLKPGGHVVIATFAKDGPVQCSGLPVVRYSVAELQLALGDNFSLVTSMQESHHTPFNSVQEFIYCHFLRKSAS